MLVRMQGHVLHQRGQERLDLAVLARFVLVIEELAVEGVEILQRGTGRQCRFDGHRTGLVGAAYNEAAPAKFVGYVTRLPAQNNGKLRFMTGWRR